LESLTTSTSLPASVNSISILLTDDFEIRELNKNYRQLDKTTDVLSFSMLETFGEDYQGSDLGDIVISIPKAYRQAKRYKVSDSEEVLRLLIHGMLHLFGYDHVAVSTKKAKQMFDLQNLLLKKNLSDLYRSRKGISCSEIAV